MPVYTEMFPQKSLPSGFPLSFSLHCLDPSFFFFLSRDNENLLEEYWAGCDWTSEKDRNPGLEGTQKDNSLSSFSHFSSSLRLLVPSHTMSQLSTSRGGRKWLAVAVGANRSLLLCLCLSLFLFFFKLINLFILLYNIILVLPYIDLNLPWMYMCSSSWIPLLPPSPSHPSGSSQCTSPKHPVLCIEPGLAICFNLIIYMFQCHSPISSHPCPLPQSPKDCSIHLCLFCCLAYRVIVTIFLNSIYMH